MGNMLLGQPIRNSSCSTWWPGCVCSCLQHFFGNASTRMNSKHGVTPVPIARFSEWPKINKGLSTYTHAVDKHEYALHQAAFTKKGGILPQYGAVRWSLRIQLQCKLVGDGHGGWVSFANKPNEVRGAGAVQHLGGLRVVDKKGVSELA